MLQFLDTCLATCHDEVKATKLETWGDLRVLNIRFLLLMTTYVDVARHGKLSYGRVVTHVATNF